MDNPRASGARSNAVMPERMFLTAEEVGKQLGLRRSRVYELAAVIRPDLRLDKDTFFPRRSLGELGEDACVRT